jgi:predicted permease
MGFFIGHAWRAWRNARPVALLAILALAVGIGSAVSIYTIVNAVLLRPLPFENGGRWVVVFATKRGAAATDMQGVTDPDLLYFKERAHSFDAFGWFGVFGDFNLTAPGEPQHLHGLMVTPSLVDSLGVPMLKGRWFRELHDEPTGVHSAVISHNLWRRLGSPADIAGQTITVDGALYTVTGVAPAWFRLAAFDLSGLITREDVWLPLDELARQKEKSFAGYLGYARLRPGIQLEQASAEVKQIAAEIVRSNPNLDPDYTAGVRSLKETVSSPVRAPLLLLLSATGLLLFITCANVAGLLVARSVHRAREIAIRVALGAGRLQFGIQYFTEAFLVAAAGAILGIIASYAALRLFLRFAESYIPRADEIRVDWRVLAFAAGLAILTALLSCFAPLWQAARTQPNESLSEGTRSSAGLRSRRLSRWLVVSEIGLAFTLLCSAALLRGNADYLLHMWPGFEARNLSVFDLQPSKPAYSDDKKLFQYEQRLIDAVQSIPGVENVAIGSQLPMGGCCFNAGIISDDPRANTRYTQAIDLSLVSPEYFRTLGIPLVAGRVLTEHDDTDHPVHVLVNEAATKQFWPSGNAVGGLGRLGSATGDPFQVVGIVSDVRIDTLDKPPPPELYVLNAQGRISPLHVFVKTRLSEGELFRQVRRALASVDRTQPVYDLSTMHEVLQSSMFLQQGTSAIASFFAFASLLMAVLGIYGVTSYFVRQRTVELGTRMALGAVPGNLIGLVFESSWKLCAGGLAIGAAATALATWILVRNFNLQHVSWQAFVYTFLILAAVTILAASFPAWRASLLTPMAAIRDNPESLTVSHRRSLRDLIPGLAHGNGQAAANRPVVEATLLAEFIEAARRADSFDAALTSALGMLQQRIQAQSIFLLEKSPDTVYSCVAALPVSCAVAISSEGFLVNRMRFYPLPLPITEDDYPVLITWAAANKPAYVPELEDLKQLGIRLAAGLRTQREILGILLFGSKVDDKPYTSDEMRLLRVCAEQLALMLENGRLTQRVVEQEKVRRDLALATEVQRRLLPERSPELAIGQLAAYTLPARSVGGDYYDFLQVGDHRIGVALADVAGKGIAAALIMSVVQASLRVLLADGSLSLPDLTARLNRFLHRSTGSSSYATFFYAQVDEETRELRYVNAGHNPPFLLRRDETSVEPLARGGMIIGLFPMASYEEGTVMLRPGDVLIVFTDGVTEALNPDGEEFGEQRLQDLLKRVAHLSAKEMAPAIAGELRNWISTADQHDDLTFVVLKVD